MTGLTGGRGQARFREANPLDAPNPKFEVGQIVITPAATAALEASGQTLAELLIRHQAGDWGDATEQVQAVNEQGLAHSLNLQSVYPVVSGQRLVVVTNRERTMTMIHVEPGGR